VGVTALCDTEDLLWMNERRTEATEDLSYVTLRAVSENSNKDVAVERMPNTRLTQKHGKGCGCG
jgi:hypothetical protein